MWGHLFEGDLPFADAQEDARLALQAALQLQTMRRARVTGIWYGSYDPDTKQAPVYNLNGLLRIAEWLQALHTYDKDGDSGATAPPDRAIPLVDLTNNGQLIHETRHFSR